jgi:hypothetical protein
MPLITHKVKDALERLASIRPGDKVRFFGTARNLDIWSEVGPVLEIDRKGLFQGLVRGKEDSITEVANRKAIISVILAGAEEVSCRARSPG